MGKLYHNGTDGLQAGLVYSEGVEIMILKEYDYTNDIGWPKKMVIDAPEDGKYNVTIWDRKHGEYCGGGRKTIDELNEILAHYGLPLLME